MMNRLPSPRLLAIALAAGSLAVFPLLGCDSESDAVPWDLQEEGDGAGDGENGGGGDLEPGMAESVLLYDETSPLVNGYVSTITVDVPENVHSMTITVTEGNPEAQFAVTSWIGPDGFEIVKDGWEQSSQSGMCYPDCNNRVVLSAAAFAAIAPNNPASQVTPGEHSFRVFGLVPSGTSATPAAGQVRVQVHTKVVHQEVPETGTLDLNLFFTGAGGWTAESAQADPAFQAMLENLDGIYDQVGISLGEISYNDADSDYQVIEDVTSGTGDLSELFAKSERAPLNGPSVFFVDDLRMSGGPFGMIAGIAGGIPGPIRTQGSPRSGVAIALEILDDPQVPFTLEQVVGHELGHYLGLFHTTENEFAQMFPGFMPAHDPLPDTPENDESYLMFYSGSGDTLSPWQGRVMRKNPWVRHN